MQNLASGRYNAEVLSVALTTVGQNDIPCLSVNFRPVSFYDGVGNVHGDYPEIRKYLFLSEKIVRSGKSAGKTGIEVLRENLKEVFDYEGGLSEEDLKVLFGKKCSIVVGLNERNYSEVKFINKIGGQKRQVKTAALSQEQFNKLNALFAGKQEVAPASAEAFFETLKKAG